jgi:hypothetical protein
MGVSHSAMMNQRLLVGLLFDPEDGSSMLLRNADCMASLSIR